MTFIPERRIEALAAEIWRRHSLELGFDVEQLLDELDLGLVRESVDDEDGAMVLGQLLPAKRLVVLNERHIELLEEKDGRLRRYTVGHEIGHWTLRADAVRSGTLSLFDGERIWCRDGSRDPVERSWMGSGTSWPRGFASTRRSLGPEIDGHQSVRGKS